MTLVNAGLIWIIFGLWYVIFGIKSIARLHGEAYIPTWGDVLKTIAIGPFIFIKSWVIVLIKLPQIYREWKEINAQDAQSREAKGR